MSSYKIAFIVNAQGNRRPKALLTMLSSLICQTEEDWEAIIMDSQYSEINASYCAIDERMTYCVHSGPTMYHAAEAGAAMAHGEWLAFPNDDGYYTPHFAERLIAKGESENLDLVYCDLVWGREDTCTMLDCYPVCCSIDKTNFIVRSEKMIPFPHKDDVPDGWRQSDGHFIEALVASGIRHGKVPQLLAVHN